MTAVSSSGCNRDATDSCRPTTSNNRYRHHPPTWNCSRCASTRCESTAHPYATLPIINDDDMLLTHFTTLYGDRHFGDNKTPKRIHSSVYEKCAWSYQTATAALQSQRTVNPPISISSSSFSRRKAEGRRSRSSCCRQKWWTAILNWTQSLCRGLFHRPRPAPIQSSKRVTRLRAFVSRSSSSSSWSSERGRRRRRRLSSRS